MANRRRQESSENTFESLRLYLGKILSQEQHILAAYVFGSSLAAETRRPSDLDLAFLLEEESYQEDPLGTISPAYLCAAHLAGQQHIKTDVTILNTASLEIAYEVVITGLCLFQADLERRLQYEAKIRGMYFDFRPFLTDLRSKSIARL